MLISKILRDFGFDVSIDQSIDIARSYSLFDSIEDLKLAIGSIVAKTPDEKKLFNFLFDQIITGESPLKEVLDKAKENEAEEWGIKPDEKFRPQFGNNPHCPNPIGGVAIGAGTGLATVSGLTNPNTLLSFHSDFKFVLRKMVEENIESAADALVSRYILALNTDFDEVMNRKENALQKIKSIVDQLFPRESEKIKTVLENAVNKRLIQVAQPNENNSLKLHAIEEKDFFQLKENHELREALKRIAKRISTVRKRKLEKGGRKIDFRRTFRKNLQNGGVLVDLMRRRPRKTKPRLIVLTDVSPSTVYATKLFLLLLGELKEQFNSIRFYEFIGSCIDVTTAYESGNSLYQSVNAAIGEWEKVAYGKQSSNYELALTQFERMAREYLSSKTTLVILGDLRDWLGSRPDGYPNSAKILGTLKEKVNRIIVLNPEPKRYWDTADSIVSFVRSLGIIVTETTNLRQLERSLLEEVMI